MKKKTYKAMKNELYRQIKRAVVAECTIAGAEQRAGDAENKAQFYAERFRKLGSNVETVNPGSDKLIKMIKWELDPLQYGQYIQINLRIAEYGIDELKNELVRNIASSLIDNDFVQFIAKEPDKCGGPLSPFGTIGAKLYVIPWEQMPHKRTVEIGQYVENTLEEGGTIK